MVDTVGGRKMVPRPPLSSVAVVVVGGGGGAAGVPFLAGTGAAACGAVERAGRCATDAAVDAVETGSLAGISMWWLASCCRITFKNDACSLALVLDSLDGVLSATSSWEEGPRLLVVVDSDLGVAKVCETVAAGMAVATAAALTSEVLAEAVAATLALVSDCDTVVAELLTVEVVATLFPSAVRFCISSHRCTFWLLSSSFSWFAFSAASSRLSSC